MTLKDHEVRLNRLEVSVETLMSGLAKTEASIDMLVHGLHESVDAQKENSKVMSELVAEMRERAVREEYREKELLQMSKHIDDLEDKVDSYVSDIREPFERLVRSQELSDKVKSAMLSTWGKFLALGLAIGAAYALGLEISWFKGGK